MDDKLRVKMFGEFEMSIGDCSISEKINNSKKMWRFLKYIIIHKDKPVSQKDLIDVLWPGGNSKDPYNALKNLLYRLRIALEENDMPNAKKIITLKNNKFAWNAEVECEFDFIEFEKLIKEINIDGISEERTIELCFQALEIYRGDLARTYAGEQWIVPVNTYYHTLYIELVKKICGILMENRRYDEIIQICENSIKIDEYEESFYEFMINSLLKKGSSKEAMRRYESVVDLFYNKLGINISQSFKSLYREIIKTEKNTEFDLSVIKDDLREQSRKAGAFLCEYEIFKDIYRIEARLLERTGKSIYIALFNMTDMNDDAPVVKILSSCMENFLEIAVKSLRKGDVISRFSQSQYILLLPGITYENAEIVLERIIKNYKRVYPKKKVKIFYTLQPMEPIINI